MTTPSVLLKRSDGPVYKLYSGSDCDQAAANLELNQAFSVDLVLSSPHTVSSTPTIDEPCRPLKNGWFHAPSDDQAALVLLHNRISNAPDTSSTMEPSTTDDDALLDIDANEGSLWEHLEPCTSQQAAKAVELRSALTAKLGKGEAARLLGQCKATVAKSADGQKNRVLKSRCGRLLKLRS